MTAAERASICSECKKSLADYDANLDRCPFCGAPLNGDADGSGFALGTMGYCFSGQGWIVAPLSVALPVAATFASTVYLYDCFYLPSAILIPLGCGWILAGVMCWMLGRIWNHGRASHRFLGYRVDSWGLFEFISGVLILLPILLLDLDSMTVCAPDILRVVCGWLLGPVAVACVLLQLIIVLIDSTFLFIWTPIYVISVVVLSRIRLTHTRIPHEHR